MTTTTATRRHDWAAAGTEPPARVRTCFVLDADVEEAARFWISLLPDSEFEHAYRTPEGGTHIVEFTLAGAPYMLFNASFGKEHTPAASISVLAATQAEVDRLWAALTDGGSEVECGWCKDRYGVHWQVVPDVLPRLLHADDKDAATRAFNAMLHMKKMDIAELESAFAGR
jgi:predicted 3-demethylubiquinone-9 3-methyltransferase (glyoxalase superfamily)